MQIKLLHIDGDPTFLRSNDQRLAETAADFSIDRVANSAEALSRIYRYEYDAVLSELVIPYSSGVDMIHSIRESNAEIPIIILSNLKDVDVLVEAFRAGANDFFYKKNLARLDMLFIKLRQYVHNSKRKRDATETDLALKEAIVESSLLTGVEFFHSLVKRIALTLGTQSVLVGRLVIEGERKIQTVSLYHENQIIQNLIYPLEGTPCDMVVGKSFVYYKDNIQSIFPKDKKLVTLRAESYCGSPLFDRDGQPMGLIAAIDRTPVADVSVFRMLFTAVSSRAGIELERLESSEIDEISAATLQTFSERIEAAGRAEHEADAAALAEEEEDLDILPLREIERRAILDALKKFDGNKARAARHLGISERKLHYKAKEYESES